MTLVEDFISEEGDAYAVNVIWTELANRKSGEAYLTFNRFNLRLDIDSGTATIEDELDPSSEYSLPISELLGQLPEVSI